MSIVHSINVALTKSAAKDFKKKIYRGLLYPELKTMLDHHGSGLYAATLVGTGNNWIAKRIAEKCHGYVHFVVFAYGDEWKDLLNPIEKGIVRDKLKRFYLDPPSIEDMDSLVLASADSDGMNYFAFSHYQERNFTIRKIPLPNNIIMEMLLREFIKIHNAPYDATGLVYELWKSCLTKWLDDRQAWFCSEQSDILVKYGIYLTTVKDPTPWDIQNSRPEWVVFNK